MDTPIQCPYRAVLIVEAWELAAAAEVATRTGLAGEADRASFGVPLSPTGSEPPTHYACSTGCTDDMRARMRVEIAAGVLSTLVYYVWTDDDDRLLIATNQGTSYIYSGPWGVAASLADVGLSVIRRGE